MHIVQGGEALATIVISSVATPVERQAAEELQRYIEEISGAKLPVVNVPTKGRVNIYIGQAVPTIELDLSETTLGFDGYIVKTVGSDLILTGIKPYSSLYAVYHLLERYLGCGFFEDGDQVPRKNSLTINEIHDVCRPYYKWRMYHCNMQYAYSGMTWWNFDQLKGWVDYLVKKRLNMWEPVRVVNSIGLVAAAATKMGIPIEHTPWQKERIALFRKVLEYANILGITVIFTPSQYNQGNEGNTNEPGTYNFPDRIQLVEFLRRYEEKTGEKIPTFTYVWSGVPLPAMDVRNKVAQEFVGCLVESYRELFGIKPFYMLSLPAEGGWESNDLEEMNKVTYAMVMDLVNVVRKADPEAVIWISLPFPFAKTFEAQKKACIDAGLHLGPDFWLNVPGRYQGFLMCDYFWGLPWGTGMVSHCGTHTNPWGDMQIAIQNAKKFIADPKAAECDLFTIGNEINHRNIMIMDLFAEIAWHPKDVELDDFITRYTQRRYGHSAAKSLVAASKIIASTLLSNYNMDNTNGPLYRRWNGGYWPGTTPLSVRRTLGYLPKLRLALELLLEKHDDLKDNPLYRFDLVDIGRTYLGAIFNDYLARTRKALRAQDRTTFEHYSKKTIDVMHFIARYCSTDPEFRLKTRDDWANRWHEILPGHANSESNWITFTALISPTHWKELLDYMAEDMAELMEHYYIPRVELYISKMRELLDQGRDISGRMVYRGTNTDMPYRIGDWATPVGLLPWSPYGAPCEPELTSEDHELAHRIIEEGTVSGRYDFYEGPIDVLVRELLEKYPVPEDLQDIVSEKEPEVKKEQTTLLAGKPGDVVQGFNTPGIVEKVIIPKELEYVVAVEEISKGYNLMRGNIASYRVSVSDYIRLKRLPDERAMTGLDNVAVFEFEVLGRRYLLKYDPGSDYTIAGLFIEPAL